MIEAPASREGVLSRFRSLFSPDRSEPVEAPVAEQLTHLRECLVIIARLLGGRPVSADTLAGLPTENGQISLRNFSRACERIGLQTLIAKRKFKEISPAILPCIILTNANRAVILYKMDGEGGDCEKFGGGSDSVMPGNLANGTRHSILNAAPDGQRQPPRSRSLHQACSCDRGGDFSACCDVAGL